MPDNPNTPDPDNFDIENWWDNEKDDLIFEAFGHNGPHMESFSLTSVWGEVGTIGGITRSIAETDIDSTIKATLAD